MQEIQPFLDGAMLRTSPREFRDVKIRRSAEHGSVRNTQGSLLAADWSWPDHLAPGTSACTTRKPDVQIPSLGSATSRLDSLGAFMEERRVTPRHRVLKTGTIEFGGEAIPCVVRSLSPAGARIEINTPLWFPEHFVLAIPSDGLHQPCRVIWREEKLIGLAFDQS